MSGLTYPEHDRLAAIDARKKLGITEFLEWLEDRGYVICETFPQHHGTEYAPTENGIEDWLSEFFEIDREKLESEKQEMLAELRYRGT